MPKRFAKNVHGLSATNDSFLPDHPNSNNNSIEISTTTLLQKEYSTDNIWRNVGKFNELQTQRNYDRVIHKRSLSEIEAFESKVEEMIKEYRDFVDDGVSRKQLLF